LQQQVLHVKQFGLEEFLETFKMVTKDQL